VAVHCNAAGASATGSEVYYFRPWASSLASKTSSGLASALSSTNRGSKYGLYYVTRVAQYPSVLAECGFITNQAEFKKLCTSSYQSKMASRMAVAIEDYLSSAGSSSPTGVQSVGSTDVAEATGVTLNPTTLTVAVGETATITSTVAPANADQSVTWTTSDAKIAKVDETGKVTGVKAGKATITATTANGKTATCAVTVADAYTIELNKTELTLMEKAAETLTATVKQGSTTVTNQTVTWTSSDTAVATVSNSGKVSAVKEGTATITAALANGKTATCKVTVTKEKVPVTAITLSPASMSLVIGVNTTITATLQKSLTVTSSTTTAKESSSNKTVCLLYQSVTVFIAVLTEPTT